MTPLWQKFLPSGPTWLSPSVTPLSQMVGNQAVTNVLVGERYKNISKEIKSYLKGEYGIAPAPVNAELQKKVLTEAGMDAPVDCRIEDSKRTGEDFKAARLPWAIWPEAKKM